MDLSRKQPFPLELRRVVGHWWTSTALIYPCPFSPAVVLAASVRPAGTVRGGSRARWLHVPSVSTTLPGDASCFTIVAPLGFPRSLGRYPPGLHVVSGQPMSPTLMPPS